MSSLPKSALPETNKRLEELFATKVPYTYVADGQIGEVAFITRKGKTFSVGSRRYRLYVKLWKLLFPVRKYIVKIRGMPFYERLGFEPFGDEFDEAGIPHRMMRLVF